STSAGTSLSFASRKFKFTCMLESANKAFIAGGLDIQYIFTGQSDREAFKKKDLQIHSFADLLKKAYQGE
ncbi:MAG: hypothetical protein VXC58_06425, partial [Deltaproteobacteria bacterium]